MDVALTASCDLKRWTRRFQVPAVHLWQDVSGTWLEFEGVQLDLRGNTIGSLVSGFIGARGPYECTSSQTLVDREGTLHAFPAVEKWDCKKLVPEESTFSAWDRAGDLLKNGWHLALDDGIIGDSEDRRLIELGVAELDVVTLECPGKQRYVELTGDLARVFDGLF